MVQYIASIDNLGLAPQRGHRLLSVSFWKRNPRLHTIYECVFWFLLKYQFYLLPFKKHILTPKFHYLAFLYIRGKSIQAVIISCILVTVMILDVTIPQQMKYECFMGVCAEHLTRRNMINHKSGYIGQILVEINVVQP